MDSIVTAIQQDKYPLDTLIHMMELSLKKYQDKMAEKNIQIHHALSA